MGGVLVDEKGPLPLFHQDVGLEELAPDRPGFRLRCRLSRGFRHPGGGLRRRWGLGTGDRGLLRGHFADGGRLGDGGADRGGIRLRRGADRGGKNRPCKVMEGKAAGLADRRRPGAPSGSGTGRLRGLGLHRTAVVGCRHGEKGLVGGDGVVGGRPGGGGEVGLRGTALPVQGPQHGVIEGVEDLPLADEFYLGLGGVDIHIHAVEPGGEVEDAAGELAHHALVLIGLLQSGHEEPGFDEAAIDKEVLVVPGAPTAGGQETKPSTVTASSPEPFTGSMPRASSRPSTA